MPSSAVRKFTDPDEYAAALRAANVEMTVTGRGRFAAETTSIDLHRLWMQRHSENLRRAGHSAIMSGRAIVCFGTRLGPSAYYRGVEVHPTEIVRLAEGYSFFHRSSGLGSWGSMSLPVDEMESVGAAMAGCDLTPLRDQLIISPRPAAMAKLQRLHAAVGRMAEDAPEIIANPDAARGLEEALIEALVGCLDQRAASEDRAAQRQHSLVMSRFRRALEEDPSQPLYVTEICKKIGVSDRTLEVCCQERLGMGPKRYLVLRRLNLARRALREAAPDATTVTDVATQYGFWHFGRFAGEYRSLFGESPSVTLHRQA